jgi:prepilin signal peptidase PulO-like enzyme (type II secretory pathway)
MIDALSIATILGLIQIGILSIRDRRIPRSIPFAPALIAGAIIAL